MRAACECTALALMLGLAVCADGITALPGGWWVLYGGIALAYIVGQLPTICLSILERAQPFQPAPKSKKKTAPVLQHQSGRVKTHHSK